MALDSFRLNPSTANIGLTNGTSNWLWAVFAIMVVTDLLFIFWSFKRPQGQRIFHQLPIIILTTSAIAYFAMASNLGSTPIAVEFIRDGFTSRPTRAIWYVRYIQWTITMPLLLLMVALASALPLGDIVTVVFMSVVFVVTRLVGALVQSRYKWGFWAFSVASLIYIWSALLGSGRKSTVALHAQARKPYTTAAAFLSFIWMLYPIAWGLSEGGNVINTTGEMIWYGILDLLAMPVFCLLHNWGLRRVPYEHYGFNSGKASTGLHGPGYGGIGDNNMRGVGANGTNSVTGGNIVSGANAVPAHNNAPIV